MNFAIFARPVVTIYDLTETTKESDAGVVSTIGDEGLYGQVCQVRTAPGGVTAEGVTLPEEMAEVVSFYGYHGYVFASELQFCGEAELRSYLAAEWVMAGRATDVLTLPKVQGVRLLELERGALLRRLPEEAPHDGWALVRMSLHEPILPVNIESDTEGGVKKIAAQLYKFLQAYPFLELSAFDALLS